jgi:hypothetical protein
MRSPCVRFKVRSVMITVVYFAALMALVGAIEQADHRGMVTILEGQEKQWRDAHVEAVRSGNGRAASMYQQLARECFAERLQYQRQLGSFPRTLTASSVTLTIFSLWAGALFVVVRAERAPGRQPVPPMPRTCRLSSFRVWLLLGAISPIAIMVLGLAFARTPPAVARPWPRPVVEVLAWFQLAHALLGTLVLRGRRLEAIGIGIISIVVTGIATLYSLMAITGGWL